MNRRHVFAVTLLTTTLGLTACSAAASGTGTGVGSGVPSGEAGSTAPASSPTPTPTPTATPTPTTGNGGGVTLASGSCSTIDQQTAADILGFPTPPGTEASKAGAGSEGFKKIEGCSYRSATQGSMGYDVVRVSSALGPQLIAAAKARMKAADSAIVIFEVGMPDSFGFTQRLGKLVDSQVTVLAGDHFITVAVARKDGEVAKSQASAIAAAQKLVSG